DVNECEHARHRAADHAVFKIGKIAPARTPRIGHRGDAAAQRVTVREETQVARVRVAFARARISVDVHIDQARRAVKTFDVDYLTRLRRGNVGRDSGDPVIPDSDVPNGVDIIL